MCSSWSTGHLAPFELPAPSGLLVVTSELDRLNRAYRALCHCTAAVVHAKDEHQLIDSLCGTLVDVGGYRMAWIGYPGKDAERLVTVGAFAGVDEGYLQSVQIHWGEDEFGAGPTGTAIRDGKTTINRDSRTSPTYGPWRKEALAHGFGSSIALPLSDGDTVLAALTLYASQPEAFDEEEGELLMHVARAVGHGIAALRARQTLLLREEMLRRAAKTEALGHLAGGLIHDVNNMLTVVLGCTDELGDSIAMGDERQELVQDIRDATLAASGLARQVLMFGRGRADHARPVVLSQQVVGVEKLLRRSLGPGIELTFRTASDLAPVQVEPAHIEEMLLNLAFNARDAMAGKGFLAVEFRNVATAPPNAIPARPAGGPFVELAIRDSGAGISAEVMSHLFEPFFTTKPEGKGTGLGLAMVLDAVNRYGGQISVDSRLGHGTEFRILLPACPPTAIAPRP